MKKIIFILTYSEGDHWIKYYNTTDYQKYFPSEEYQLIILDNGNQDIVKEWASKTNAIYHRSENNIGTTGGYNWFLRVGQLLRAPRIAVMQADVFVHDPLAITYLFNQRDGTPWNSNDFVYWPNQNKSSWNDKGQDPDVGQFFSVDPNFFIENEYLCDENYTVTHYESMDLWLRMTRGLPGGNVNPAIPHNLLYEYYPDEDLTVDSTSRISKIYSYHSFSNRSFEHNEWFIYNWPYHQKKYGALPGVDSKEAWRLFSTNHINGFWSSSPWTTTPGLENMQERYIQYKVLDPYRNINIGQVPYPVEYEVNKFYLDFIKTEEQPIKQTPKHLDGIENKQTSILIIGSSGYIGSSLTQYLTEQQYLITTVDCNMFGGPSPQYKKDYKVFDKEFYDNFSHIILLAGHSSVAMCTSNYEHAWENNVTKFADLVSKLSEKHTLIYASSGSVYGYGGELRKENMVLPTASLEYDLTKQIIEKIATGGKCRTIGLRFGTVNGKYVDYARGDLMLNAMVISAKTKNTIDCFNGVNKRSILGITDCIRAIKAIIDKSKTPNNGLDKHEIYNVASFSGSIQSFAEQTGKILNVPVNVQSKITSLFSFELDCTKFMHEFNFAFEDRLETLIPTIVDSYDKIIWSIRNQTSEYKPTKLIVGPEIVKPIVTPTIVPEVVQPVTESIVEPIIEVPVVIETPVEPMVPVVSITVEPEIASESDVEDNFGVVFDAVEPSTEIVETPRVINYGTRYKKLYNCLCCGSPHLFVILDLGYQPLANSFHQPDEVLEEYELKLMGCDTCWHSQLSIAVDPDVLFKNYLYVSGTSKTLKNYFNMCADIYTEANRIPGKILDIACNDGSLLDSFKQRGWTTFGVDPAENLHAISSAKGHTIICDYWTPEVASKLPKFDVIFAQNVFAHTSDVDKFLEACMKVMHSKSKLIIQTSQAAMFDKNEFDTIYHEHISYFSVNSMKTVVERAGLFLKNIHHANVHGISYSFEIVKIDPRIIDYVEVENEKYKYNREFYDRYRENVLTCIENIRDYVDCNPNVKIVGFGAAAKGMTVINSSKIKLDYIVDENPMKIGLQCPGSNIPIKPVSALEEEPNDMIILVLAWNFYNEIHTKIITHRHSNKDRIVTYFPKIVER